MIVSTLELDSEWETCVKEGRHALVHVLFGHQSLLFLLTLTVAF